MAIPLVAGQIAVGGLEMVSGALQAETIRESAQITKQIDNLNAGYADLDAYNAEQQGITKAARYEENINQVIGAERTGFASQNVDVNFGTAAEIQAQSKLAGFLNKLDIKNQANAVAMGYKNQASNLRLNGDSAAAQGNINASATLNSSVFAGATYAANSYTNSLTGYDKNSKLTKLLKAVEET